jgi:biopolymer transport protein ExbB/TolQ
MIAAGIVYAFTESTLEGKLILLTLFLASIFSWSVMVTKIRFLSFCKRQNDRFQELFHEDRQPLRIFESRVALHGSNIFEISEAGADELCFQMLGSTEVDESFSSRLKSAEKISPAQMRSVQAAMERAVGESALRLESQMIVLSTAVSGAPFLGLLGTVWGVMDAFAGIAASGNANLAAMAPGISGSLITTIVSLLVAIPAMFGYNFLVTTLRSLLVQADNFAAEFSSEIEHRYVEFGTRESRRPLL